MAAIIGTTGAKSLKNKSYRGERSVSGSSITGTRKTFTVTYLVQATSTTENTDDILAATGIPSLLSLSDSAYLIRKSCREKDASALLWEVDCFYDSHVDPSRPRAVNWSWGSETMEMVFQRDPVTGAAIVSAAGEPMIITTPVSIPILTVEKIKPSFDPDEILLYENRVNNAVFYGAPVKTALLASIQDEPTEISGTLQRKISYIVKFNLMWDYDSSDFLGWVAQPLNHGSYYLEAAGSAVKVPFEANGNPTTGNLALDGTKLPVGETPKYLKFNKHLGANLNNLQLGPFS